MWVAARTHAAGMCWVTASCHWCMHGRRFHPHAARVDVHGCAWLYNRALGICRRGECCCTALLGLCLEASCVCDACAAELDLWRA